MTKEDLQKEIEFEEKARLLIERGYIKHISLKQLVEKLKEKAK